MICVRTNHNRRLPTFDLSMIPSRQSKYVASLIGSLGFSINGRVAWNNNDHRRKLEEPTACIHCLFLPPLSSPNLFNPFPPWSYDEQGTASVL